MKRPILGLLAAAFLSLGLLGTPPVRAATSNSPAAIVTPAHNGEEHEHGRKYSHPDRQGGTRVHDRHHGGGHNGDDDGHNGDDDGHNGDDDGHNGNGHNGRRRCSGLIVVCPG